jgi:hypothetical protein
MDGSLLEGGVPTPASSVSLEELEAQITELAGHLNAAQYRWLTLIAEFDRRQGWSDGRLASCAHWLNFKCGLNLGAAREKVRVAHALKSLPHIGAAMARGELSYSKVRAVSRVACAATEENLLMIALHGTAHHVETIVRHYRRAQQAEQLSREARQQANRSLHYWYDEDGSLVIKARLPALGGAMVVKALEAAMQEVPSTELCVAFDEEEPLSFQERRADALAMLGESYLQRRAAASSSSADRHQIVVHIDAETLKDQTAGRCHIDQGPSIPAETVRRIACDSTLVQILETEQGMPRDVGRKTRSIPPAIRRALNARDPGCCFPGCTYQRYLDAHHIEHWADGGETKLSNLVTLCRRHHRLVHEGGIAVAPRASGGWRFLKPDGQEFDVIRPAARAYDWRDLPSAHEAQGICIDRSTAATRWRGERIGYELGVWGLCHQVERARERRDEHDYVSDVHLDVSAETSACPYAASTS